VKPGAHAPSLRAATPADAQALFALHAAVLRPYVARAFGWDEAAQRQRFQAFFDPAQTRVIRCCGADVGFLQTEERDDSVYLAKLDLDPSHQGLGIGTRLIQELQAAASARGLPVTLQVLKTNPRALSLYLRLGFVLSGETSTHSLMSAPPGRSV
jgi:ribosomal protein S18 acetylase RimI-like enzyme